MKDAMLKILAFILKKEAKLIILKYKPTIVGVTGSVGKTSTKTAVASVLKGERNVRTASKNFNNEFGLPVTIIGDFDDVEGGSFWIKVLLRGVSQLIMKKTDYPEILVLEYGIDRPGDMDYLLDVARPDVGIITAIGEVPVHVEFFEGPHGVVKEKSKLIARLPSTGFAILNSDDSNFPFLREQTRGHVITYGFGENADVRITNFSTPVDAENGESSVSFKINYGGSVVPVKMQNIVGKSAAYAGAAAAASGLIFGMNLSKIAETLDKYQNPSGRERVIKGMENTTIIDDSYNASPKAMEEALGTLRVIKAKRKIAVLGDMLELGKYTKEAHEKIGDLVPKSADVLVTVGSRAEFISEEAVRKGMPPKSVFHFDNIGDAVRELKNFVKKGDLILVKGSQSVRMEKITKELMAEPLKAKDLLVRQSDVWLAKPGMYE